MDKEKALEIFNHVRDKHTNFVNELREFYDDDEESSTVCQMAIMTMACNLSTAIAISYGENGIKAYQHATLEGFKESIENIKLLKSVVEMMGCKDE